MEVATHQGSWDCARCGKHAATLYLLAPDEPDPRLVTKDAGVPPGSVDLLLDRERLSIFGGPAPMTMALSGDWFEPAIEALSTLDVAALHKINFDIVPFWCFKCSAADCADCWTAWPEFDEGFFDHIVGYCPENHRRILSD